MSTTLPTAAAMANNYSSCSNRPAYPTCEVGSQQADRHFLWWAGGCYWWAGGWGSWWSQGAVGAIGGPSNTTHCKKCVVEPTICGSFATFCWKLISHNCSGFDHRDVVLTEIVRLAKHS